MPSKPGDQTTAVHGALRGNREAPLATPLVRSSTFVLPDTDAVDDVYDGRREGYIYSRYANPTVESAARKIALLEGGDGCLLTASGMAAIMTAVLTFTRAGGRIVSVRDVYGGTHVAFSKLLPRFGVTVDWVDTADAKGIERALAEPADLLYLETPTNPTLRLVDLASAAEAARRAGVVSIVDSTFASPVNTRPLELGVDVVMHSATKYLSGHGDVTAGALVSRAELVERLRQTYKFLGTALEPDGASLLERGLKTLGLRVRRANANALAVARALEAHPKVARVHYPGLPSHPQHDLATRQMPGGFGGVLAFDLRDETKAAASRFADALQIVKNAASLGATESLVSIPVVQSHRYVSEPELRAMGITPGTVRLAMGVEDEADLVADVLQALDRA